MAWTEDEITTLKRMVAEGETYGRIQRHIPNKTRNACIGKAQRLGLVGPPDHRGGRPRKDKGVTKETAPVATPASFKGHKFMMLPEDKTELPQEAGPGLIVSDGSEVKRDDYPELFDAIKQAQPIEAVRVIEETDESITIAMDDPQWEDMNRNPLAEDRVPGGVTLDARKPHQCCWPINDGGPYLFCGAKKDTGSNYCPTHHKLMYKTSRVGDRKWVPPKVSAFKYRKS